MATTLTCPKCGPDVRLAVFANPSSWGLPERFLACPRWPLDCDYTQPLPEDLLMRETGAPRLPGF